MKRFVERIRRGYRSFQDRLLGIPVQLKILGIGALMAAVFSLGFLFMAFQRPELLWTFVGMYWVCTILGLAVAYVLTELIVQPIRELESVTREVRRQNFDARANVRTEDEIGSLAQSINRMVLFLKEFQQDLRYQHETKQQVIEKLFEVREKERARISRELHDQVGQILSSLRFRLRQLREGPPEPETINQIEESVEDTIEIVRDLSSELRPAALNDYGLEAALRQHAKKISGQFDTEVDFESILPEGGLEFDDSVDEVLYRVAQESLMNALEHAEASHVSVLLMYQENRVRLLVEDDGVGFDWEELRDRPLRECLGIRGMQERTRMIDGQIDIETEPGGGTRIRVEVPFSGGTDA